MFDKTELLKLLKENLTISVSNESVGINDNKLTVRLYFDGEEITKDCDFIPKE